MKAIKPVAGPRPTRAIGPGSFVVQLGAFANVAVAEDSWKSVSSRYRLASYTPVNATAKVNGANFVRLSVGGFASRSEAVQVCTRIKASGGSCFVRGLASDTPARWVQRGLPRQIASR
jgi:cell division septation protein DedD